MTSGKTAYIMFETSKGKRMKNKTQFLIHKKIRDFTYRFLGGSFRKLANKVFKAVIKIFFPLKGGITVRRNCRQVNFLNLVIR